jgi:tetratricopeptide (TPR) repeat protein
MPRRHLRNIVTAFAILIAFGIGRLYMEEPMAKEMVARHYWPDTMNMETRDKVGQLGFTAALGGFRSLVASIMSVQAFTHWDAGRFDQAIAQYWVIVQLQPRSYFNWFQGMQYSAFDKPHTLKFPTDDEKQRADWVRKYNEAVAEGAKFMTEAAKFLPDDYRIYGQLGYLYSMKFIPQDWCAAADYYRIAAACPNSKPYYPRFRAYALSQCPGREQEAYRLLKEAYDAHERFPSVLSHLRRMEEFLKIPQSDRIPPSDETPK